MIDNVDSLFDKSKPLTEILDIARKINEEEEKQKQSDNQDSDDEHRERVKEYPTYYEGEERE